MNLFNEAKKKDKILNLPKNYTPTRKGEIHKIRTSEIYSVNINEKKYMTSLFDSDDLDTIIFKEPIDFQLFIFDNFFKITKIYCNLMTVSYDYHLKNGYLHNSSGQAFVKYDRKGYRITGGYYINGRELDEEYYKRLLREKKLNRIVDDDLVI